LSSLYPTRANSKPIFPLVLTLRPPYAKRTPIPSTLEPDNPPQTPLNLWSKAWRHSVRDKNFITKICSCNYKLNSSDIYLLNIINATTFSRYIHSIIELIRQLVLYILLLFNLFACVLFTLLSLVVALSKVLITYNFQTFT